MLECTAPMVVAAVRRGQDDGLGLPDDAFSLPCPPEDTKNVPNGHVEDKNGAGIQASRSNDEARGPVTHGECEPRRHKYLKDHAVDNILSWIPEEVIAGAVLALPYHPIEPTARCC